MPREAAVLVEPRAHRAPVDPLHDDEEDRPVLVEVIDADDAGGVERGDGRRLAVEALAEAWVARETPPIAPRPSSASIGYRPSCVVLTLGSMGLSVCPTVQGFPPSSARDRRSRG